MPFKLSAAPWRRIGGFVLVAAVAAALAACGSGGNNGASRAATTAPSGAVPVSAAATAAPTQAAPATSAAATPASTTATGAPPASTQVQIKDIAFPDAVTIRPGGSVTWTNKDGFAHTVTSDSGQAQSFDSGQVQSGATFSVTFARAGTYAYHCSIHASMHGTIVVSDTAAVGAAATSTQASPAKSTAPNYHY